MDVQRSYWTQHSTSTSKRPTDSVGNGGWHHAEDCVTGCQFLPWFFYSSGALIWYSEEKRRKMIRVMPELIRMDSFSYCGETKGSNGNQYPLHLLFAPHWYAHLWQQLNPRLKVCVLPSAFFARLTWFRSKPCSDTTSWNHVWGLKITRNTMLLTSPLNWRGRL